MHLSQKQCHLVSSHVARACVYVTQIWVVFLFLFIFSPTVQIRIFIQKQRYSRFAIIKCRASVKFIIITE
jgi:hypothetical protein